jgi:hypothetical protein
MDDAAPRLMNILVSGPFFTWSFENLSTASFSSRGRDINIPDLHARNGRQNHNSLYFFRAIAVRLRCNCPKSVKRREGSGSLVGPRLPKQEEVEPFQET